jgi:hypothetical protein
MKKWILLLSIFLHSGNGVNASTRDHEVTITPIEYAKKIDFSSEILGRKTEMNLYLPTSFSASSMEHTYPVIVANGSHGKEFFHTLTGVVKHLGELDRMPVSIVVSLNDSGYYPATFTNGMWGRDKLEAYEDPELYVRFLQQELFPYLKQNYQAADYTMLIGVSGSALFPLYSLTHHPDLFDYHILTTSHDMIGMGFVEDMDIIEHIQQTFENRSDIGTSLYFGVADDDINRNTPQRDAKYQDNMQRLMEMLQRVGQEKLKSKVEVIENERHYDVYIKALLSAFEFQFPEHRWAKKYRELIALPGNAMDNIEKHYQTLSAEYGFTILPKGDRWNSVNCLRLVSRNLTRDKRLDEAAEVAYRWAELRPFSPQPYERLAQIYIEQYRHKEALNAINQAIGLAR